MRTWIVGVLALSACAAQSRKAEGPLIPLGKNAQGAEEFLRTKDGMVVVFIPKGDFILGDDKGDPEERPAHKETIDHDYLMDKYEVCNEQFARFMNEYGKDVDEKGRALIDPTIAGLERVNGVWRATPGRERHPAVAPTFWGAEAYAKWVGGTIPNSWEWEKAGRGPNGQTFPWGEEPPDSTLCNFAASGVHDTVPVGSYPKGASYYGCMEMAGNAYERVYGQLGARRGGGMRPGTIKGGCYLSAIPFQMRPADLCGFNTDKSGPWMGFRCAMRTGTPESQKH
jgi:formylglycine-generating enzyme required for sulfatase activity